MARRRKKRRGLFASLIDALLSLLDWLCEGLAAFAAGLARAVGRGILLLLRGLARLVALALRLLALPFVCAARRLGAKNRRAAECLRLSGAEFEDYAALVLRDNGFRHVEQTRLSGDQGVDILAERNGVRYAVQCKNYDGAVGNFAVQEAYAGMEYYGCDAAAVLCPGEFTKSARELAQSTGVELWDGERLSRMMKISGRKPGRSARSRQ